MRIIIYTSAHIEWLPATESPSEEAKSGGRYKLSSEGLWLARSIVTKDTYTEVVLPEQQIESLAAHFELSGAEKTRGEIVAWWIEEKTAPHHCPVKFWRGIEVEKEPDIALFLNARFALKAGDFSS